MVRLEGFAPIADARARLLILGSMPGGHSLRLGEYYAHPRNRFWPIMAELCGFDAALAYPQRLEALKSSGIALWDVLHACRREGSADAKIDDASLELNDIAGFLRQHPRIHAILFNGAKAEQCFLRHARSTLDETSLRCLRLPSTSPAHATLGQQQKLAAWRSALSQFDPGGLACEQSPIQFPGRLR